MNIYIILFSPLLMLMFKNFKLAFLLFAVLKIFLSTNINLLNKPGLPVLSLEIFFNLAFITYAFMFKKRALSTNGFPLKKAFYLVFFSIFISTFFSTVGISSAFTRAIQYIVNTYIFAIILWNSIEDFRDLRLLLKALLVSFIFIVLYGIFEKITGANPIANYTISLNESTEKIIDYTYASDGRLGMGRIKSAIIHPIGLGMLLSLIIYIFLSFHFVFKNIYNNSTLLKLTFLFLGIAVIFFTNSRSPLIFLSILFLPFLSLKKRSTFYLIGSLIIGFVFLHSHIIGYLANITSLVNIQESSNNVGGSNFQMRFSQFIAAITLTKGNYLIGLGVKSIDNYIGVKYGILGAESIWISLLIERGVIGIFTHSYLLYIIYNSKTNYITSLIKVLTFSWLLITTITSVPGCDFSFFLTILFILLKADAFIFNEDDPNNNSLQKT